MFWSAILPFKITVAMTVIVVVMATVLSPRWRVRRSRMLAWSLLIACLAFVPSCVMIQAAVDLVRFGEFHYDEFDDIHDWRVERYLPDAARDITLVKSGSGFLARFTIDQASLDDWNARMWKLYEAEIGRPRPAEDDVLGDPDRKFDELGWQQLQDFVEYAGPYELDWGGPSIWYSPTEQLAYEWCGYW
jgi:hypothetical protein